MSANWISKTKVGKAGEALTSPLSSSEDRAAALEVVNYWRGIHAEALQRAFGDIEGLNAVGSDVLIAGESRSCRRLSISSEGRTLPPIFRRCTTLRDADWWCPI